MLLPHGVEVQVLYQPPLTPRCAAGLGAPHCWEEVGFTPLFLEQVASINSCAGEGGRLVTKEWDESPGSPPRGVQAPHCIGVRV